jgi:hypothetical protein
MNKQTNSRISDTHLIANNSSITSPYLTNIKNTIKNKLSSNLRMYLIIMIPVIILLCYFVYKYNFNSRTLDTITNMNYKQSLQLSNLPNCYEIDITMQYKLCDYYISSSYMTPCVGNQHYDYISTDMIVEVIQSGARYMQIPICEADISPQATPVVATAQYGQKVITSLNTLDVRTVLNIIRSNAFKLSSNNYTQPKNQPTSTNPSTSNSSSNSSIVNNYPLIIHFILNTNNSYTLGELAKIIEETISDILVDAAKYSSFPIFLEKMCNLLGKIIIFATPEYQGTSLEKYVIPSKTMFEVYHYSQLNNLNISSNDAYTSKYYNKLSTTQQIKNNKNFKQKYPSLDYIIQNTNTIGATILNDKDILNNLTQFNKVGMTMIKAQNYTDVISSNYNPADAIYYGCQFITMNFQVNDDNMKNYLKIFKNSSFVLKPGSMRFSEKEEPLPDLLSIYKSVTPKNNNIINDIYNNYYNCLIALEPYSLPKTYLTQTDTNLSFSIGSTVTRDKFSAINNKIGLEQCFLISKSSVGTGNNDVPIFLKPAKRVDMLITLNGNYFDLKEKAKTKANLNKQSFYFEKSKVNDNTTDGKLISLRTIDPNNTMFLAFENKKTKAYPSSSLVEAQNNMSFILHVIPFAIQIKLITLFDGSVKTMSGAILGILENNTTDGTGYLLEAVNKNTSKNFNWAKDQFYMKNSITNTYVVYDSNTYILYDNATNPNSNCIFNLTMANGFYVLLNSKGQNLILFQNNLLKFTDANQIVSNENLFKIDLQYILH